MTWLMGEMKARDFYFIDSRTTPKSVAGEVAKEFEVFSSSRDVFLDNERTRESIDAEFQKLVKKAREEGTAIAIGHPKSNTLNALQKWLPTLEEKGLTLAPLSAVVQHKVHSENLKFVQSD